VAHAKVEVPSEGAVAIVHLSPEAIDHLGIETTVVTVQAAVRTRSVAGVVTVPAGGAVAVTAPVAGTLRIGDRAFEPGDRVAEGDTLFRLVPIAPVDRDVKAQSRRQSASTQARLDVATARVARLEKLLVDGATSARAVEEAKGELGIATAEHDAALDRVRAIDRAPLASDVMVRLAAPRAGIVRTKGAAVGQVVAAGAALFEVTPVASMWLRVPVYPGDLAALDPEAAVTVSRLGRDAASWQALPIAAPPSADPSAASVDLFYRLPADAALVVPGERVAVQLPYRAQADASVVPAAAVVTDFDGGSWVYACDGDGGFSRRRVEVERVDGDDAILARGPALDTCVVSVGAIELLGAEFGVSH